MDCLDCGNCSKGETVYYCPARNDFVLVAGVTKIKERKPSGDRTVDDWSERRRRARRERGGSMRGIS
ncbi:MAG: hypothetical protein GX062_03775 [Firmicutes bacterium]|jgi:hypothetical protein|nr:hypothetical protein [Bacillota bacterium]